LAEKSREKRIVMMSIKFRSAAVASAIISLTSVAEAAPQQLLSKTVAVTFGFHTPAKGADGSTNTNTRSMNYQIYVSEKGRLFVKFSARDPYGRSAGERSVAPGDDNNWNVAGNNIVGVTRAVSGAARVTISFDASYQTCSASVLVGSERGSPYKFIGSNGVMYTATGASVISNIGCSISQGNGLAR
jgi:hypothetical protein